MRMHAHQCICMLHYMHSILLYMAIHTIVSHDNIAVLNRENCVKYTPIEQ